MHVVYVTNDFLDETGGTARHVEELSSRMAQRCQVTVIYLSLRGRVSEYTDQQNRHIICLPNAGHAGTRAWRFPHEQIAGVLRQYAADIVHVHSPLEAAVLRRPPQGGFLYTLHSSTFARLTQRWLWREHVLPRLWSKFDAMIAPSQAIANGVRHACCVTIPNGVDLAVFTGSRPSVAFREQEWLSRYQIDTSGRTVLLTVARLEAVKGVLSFLRQNTETLRDNRLIYVIAGDGSERQVMDKLVSQAGLTNVHLLGALPHDEACRLYGLSDLCIVPSLFETFGITVVEAMAAGTPVACTSAGALRELIEPNVTGFRLGDGGLSEVLRERTAWADVGLKARASVARSYDWEQVTQQTEAFYRKVTGQLPNTSFNSATTSGTFVGVLRAPLPVASSDAGSHP